MKAFHDGDITPEIGPSISLDFGHFYHYLAYLQFTVHVSQYKLLSKVGTDVQKCITVF